MIIIEFGEGIMDLKEKLIILSSAAKYDVSCVSSGSNRKNTTKGIGNASSFGICHSWSEDGRCISLLKILFTNFCIYDCAYCANRNSNDIKRAAFTVDEISNLTINFYQRNYIEGLFLSSGIIQNPDFTMELLIQVVKKLRTELFFNGYIHVKAIPGADLKLIREAGLYADRMSVNIELPSESSLKLLAPNKKKEDILNPMQDINNQILMLNEEKKRVKKKTVFVPAGQSTQLIIGATPDTDLQIMKLSAGLYGKYHLKRVYYSAFVPVNNDKRLPTLYSPPLLRENRLYQTDWLLRYYGFNVDEILDQSHPYLEEDVDPKVSWALRNINLFPIEINKVDYALMLRIPGIGVKSVEKIIKARKFQTLNYEALKKMGVGLKRAKYFITCNGKMLEKVSYYPEVIRKKILHESYSKKRKEDSMLSLFSY